LSEDADIDLWKRRRLFEMQKRLLMKKSEEERKKTEQEQPADKNAPKELLKKIFVGRAMEVWDVAWKQYPNIMKRLEPDLARLVQNGEINEALDENQLLLILRTIGLNLRFDTKIRILEDGKYKSISEKLKEK
jgi:DNA-binding TFAR19-related protein (PDSD5 family)